MKEMRGDDSKERGVEERRKHEIKGNNRKRKRKRRKGEVRENKKWMQIG